MVPHDLRDADRAATADERAAADAFGLDLDFREQVKPLFRWLHDHYWRVQLSGLRHLPREGPAILIANHSGALPFEGRSPNRRASR